MKTALTQFLLCVTVLAAPLAANAQILNERPDIRSQLPSDLPDVWQGIQRDVPDLYQAPTTNPIYGPTAPSYGSEPYDSGQ